MFLNTAINAVKVKVMVKEGKEALTEAESMINQVVAMYINASEVNEMMKTISNKLTFINELMYKATQLDSANLFHSDINRAFKHYCELVNRYNEHSTKIEQFWKMQAIIKQFNNAA